MLSKRRQQGFQVATHTAKTKEVKPNVSRDKEIHVATKIPVKEETLGKTQVATENLVATRIKGMGQQPKLRKRNWVATTK